MFGFFLFAVLFVALCLFTAEPAPQEVDDLRSLGELLAEVDDDLSLLEGVKAARPVPAVVDDLPSLEELLAEAEALIAKPLPPRTAALVAQAAAVAVTRIEVKAPAFAKMTAQELRKECSRRAIAWRGVREGKHLTKAQMLKALA